MKVNNTDIKVLSFFQDKQTVNFSSLIIHLKTNNLQFKKEYFFYYLGFCKITEPECIKEEIEGYHINDILLVCWSETNIKDTKTNVKQHLQNYKEDLSDEIVTKIVNLKIWEEVDNDIERHKEMIENIATSEAEDCLDNYSAKQMGRPYYGENSFCEACQSSPCMCSDPIK